MKNDLFETIKEAMEIAQSMKSLTPEQGKQLVKDYVNAVGYQDEILENIGKQMGSLMAMLSFAIAGEVELVISTMQKAVEEAKSCPA